jgi:hypothetical protein
MNIERFTMEMLKKKREEKTLLDKNIFHEKMMNYIYRELEENCLESVVLIVHKGFRHKEYYSEYKNNVKTPILDIHQKIIDQLKEDGYDVRIRFIRSYLELNIILVN